MKGEEGDQRSRAEEKSALSFTALE